MCGHTLKNFQSADSRPEGGLVFASHRGSKCWKRCLPLDLQLCIIQLSKVKHDALFKLKIEDKKIEFEEAIIVLGIEITECISWSALT